MIPIIPPHSTHANTIPTRIMPTMIQTLYLSHICLIIALFSPVVEDRDLRVQRPWLWPRRQEIRVLG